jgi:seryl-tRNA synthetase
MHDIRAIRDDPTAFDAALMRRDVSPLAEELVRLDEQRRALVTEIQNEQTVRKQLSKDVGRAKAAKDEAEVTRLLEKIARREAISSAIDTQVEKLASDLNAALAAIPNLPAADVPEGADEADNVEQKRWGTPRTFDFTAKDHADLGPPLGVDFEAGALIAGARFTVLRGTAARLHRALGQFMLDIQTQQNGYAEIWPPLLVRDEAMYGTDKLPKFAEDSFRTTDGRWLIPTAEVSLTSLAREQIHAAAALPMRVTALTACFRSEAGSAGRDTRGFIRQHQFEKVELVSITAPEQSDAEHERMTLAAEGVLEALELPYRRMLLCAGDMGFGARKTFDLEVWLPGQATYREISSCSNCGDFQARRMNARYRPEGEKGTRFVHTLNGSGLAVGRTLVAVLENYQEADGSVRVPEVLRPYMGGIDRLTPSASGAA